MELTKDDQFLLLPEFRTIINQAYEDHILQADICDVRLLKPMMKISASESLIFLGTFPIKINDEEIEKRTIVKLSSYVASRIYNIGLYYEVRVYGALIQKLIGNRETPHLIGMYLSGMCKMVGMDKKWSVWKELRQKLLQRSSAQK